MSEIEKMYENAGIELSEGLEWVCQNPDHCVYQNLSITPENCTGCEHFEREMRYPPFIAGKQIELIKWLGKLAGKLEISSNYNDTQYLLYFYLNRKTRDEILPNISTGRSGNFEESLASLINSLWQDLTEEEKQQVKGILE